MPQTSASSPAKERIIDAAVSLFNTKGYNGTSVREIANKAKVNVAHISYYFNGKGGLLEYLVSQYFEGYLTVMEQGYAKLSYLPPKDCLIQLILDILNYQHNNRQLARFVLRETTLDSVLIREVMTTYLSKEKYLFIEIFEKGMAAGEFRKLPSVHMIVQLKSLLMMPYLQPQYMGEVLYLQTHEPYFVKQYFSELCLWVQTALMNDSSSQIIMTT
ncbi:forespore capture DNA-binding protein RefZ [Metabacillus arenae]|uniref:Forespore capture DNA-binding protein RefZ n=1 Tax=Metabacillus arenae TaxID=2771434 RepID=A0A926NHK0_9BACI|nr:forespore capture DNA-binding protein RefZ [Metabacillus arenae]MBD1380138.1 forespore capture DNA-binding protein RefZ [Metabacillus arenae]